MPAFKDTAVQDNTLGVPLAAITTARPVDEVA